MRRTFTISGSVLLLLVLLHSSTAVFAAKHTVTVADFSFSPQSITIDNGDTVVWQWQSGSHPVVADNGSAFAAFTSSSATPTVERKINGSGTIGYHCTAHGSPGNGMFGTIVVRQVSGVHEELANFSLKVYPNPGSGVVRMLFDQVSGDKHTEVVIYNSIGKVVKHITLPVIADGTEIAVDVADHAAGMYFLNFIQDGKAVMTRRFVLKE